MQRLRFTAATAATLATCAASVVSQALIGHTQGAAADLSRQAVCRDHVPLCAATPAAAQAPWAGGAAYNPMRATLFYTDGIRIFEVDPDAGCRTLCEITPARAGGGFFSGLTFVPARRELHAIESRPGEHHVHTFAWAPLDGPGCLRLSSRCRVTFRHVADPGPEHVVGGIAYDSRFDVVYFVMSRFTGSPEPTLLAYPSGAPCQTFCRVAVFRDCGRLELGAIRALAIEACQRLMLVSDGATTARFSLTGLCNYGTQGCCTVARHPSGHAWSGFDVEPLSGQSIGASCVGSGCPSCASMTLEEVGRSSFGNSMYGFRITGGPTGGQAAILVGIGLCTPGTPLLCGQVYPRLAPPPIPIGPVTLSGASACTGTGTLPVRVPDDLALCGAAICVQGAVVCPGRTDAGITNAVQVLVGR